MFEDLKFLELDSIDESISYPLQMDFYAIDKIQCRYGNYSNWIKALGMDKEKISISDINFKDLLWTIVLFINEGIKVNNLNSNEKMELITTDFLSELCKNNDLLELKLSFMQLIIQVLEASNGKDESEIDDILDNDELEILDEEEREAERIRNEIDKKNGREKNNDIYINLEQMVLLCMKMGYSEYEAGLMTIKKFNKMKLAYQNLFDTELCLQLNRKTYEQLREK